MCARRRMRGRCEQASACGRCLLLMLEGGGGCRWGACKGGGHGHVRTRAHPQSCVSVQEGIRICFVCELGVHLCVIECVCACVCVLCVSVCVQVCTCLICVHHWCVLMCECAHACTQSFR